MPRPGSAPIIARLSSALIIASLIILTGMLLLAPPAHARPLKVVTTFTILQDMARNIAGDAATVVSITKPGAGIHDYQPTPRDIIKTHDADLILWNGLGLERWFARFYQNLPAVPRVIASKGVTPLPIRALPGSAGRYSGHPNPHAWMSPANGLIYIENIRRALVEHDPAHAAIYNRNAKTYAGRLRALDRAIRQRLAGIPTAQRWLVTSEGAFSYLAAAYDMKELYLWPINADGQGTPQQVRRVIDLVRRHKIPVVFSESTVSDKPARQVARETGARYGGVLHVDSLSGPDGPVPDYLSLLRITTDRIAKGFNR